VHNGACYIGCFGKIMMHTPYWAILISASFGRSTKIHAYTILGNTYFSQFRTTRSTKIHAYNDIGLYSTANLNMKLGQQVKA